MLIMVLQCLLNSPLFSPFTFHTMQFISRDFRDFGLRLSVSFSFLEGKGGGWGHFWFIYLFGSGSYFYHKVNLCGKAWSYYF